MRYAPTPATNILAALFAVLAALAFFGHRLSARLRRRMEERTPRERIQIIGPGLRLRTGWPRQDDRFEVSAVDCLRHRQGLSIGRGLFQRIQVHKVPEGVPRKGVSRSHARIDYDTDKKLFYIENVSSLNKICWAPLAPDGGSPENKRAVAGRKYVNGDLRLWLGEVAVDLRLLEPAPAPPPNFQQGNVLAAWAVTAMQGAALLLYYLGTGGMSPQLVLPGALLAIAALSTLRRDCAFTPVPAVIFVVLTCGWFFYMVYSPTPADAAINITRSFFCIGAAVIYLLPDSPEEGERDPPSRVSWYGKAGCAVLAVVVLYHYEIITTFNDSVLLLALVMSDRVRERKKLFQKAP